MKLRLRTLKPTIISKIPKVGESIFVKVGRLLPSGESDIPLMFYKDPHTFLGTNMVPGEVVELRASTAKRKRNNKLNFDAELYVHEVSDDPASSSRPPRSGGHRFYGETVASPLMSNEKQCIHNVLGHCNGCLFPRVAYGRQLVEKRRWIQNGWGIDPGKVRPGLQHGSAYTMEWRGHINKGPRGWTGTGWPVECTRVSRRARAALGVAIDQFPQVHRYHIVQGDCKDVLLVLEGGLYKVDELLKERMREILLEHCDGIMWDGEHIGGATTVTLRIELERKLTLDVASHVYIPGRRVLSEVCRALVDMIPPDVRCAWETGVAPFAASLSTVCERVVHFGPHVTTIPNPNPDQNMLPADEGAQPVVSADEGAQPVVSADEGAQPVVSLLCDWHQDATLRRLLLLCEREVEEHADDVPLGQYDIKEEQKAHRLFGNQDLVVLEKDTSTGAQLDAQNKARLRKLYRALAKKYHPDREGGDREKFAELARAYTDLMKDGEEGDVDPDDESNEVTGMLVGDALISPVVYADDPTKAPSALDPPDLVVWTVENKVKNEAFRTWLRKGLVVKHIIVVFDGPFDFIRKTVLGLGHSGYLLEEVKAFDSEPHAASFTILARLRFNPVDRTNISSGQLRLSFKQNRPLAWTKRITS